MGASLGCGYSLTGVRLPTEVLDAIKENDLATVFKRFSEHDITTALKQFEGYQNGTWRVYWPEFFEIFEKTSRKIELNQRKQMREAWHPACFNYCMEEGIFDKKEHFSRTFPSGDLGEDDFSDESEAESSGNKRLLAFGGVKIGRSSRLKNRRSYDFSSGEDDEDGDFENEMLLATSPTNRKTIHKNTKRRKQNKSEIEVEARKKQAAALIRKRQKKKKKKGMKRKAPRPRAGIPSSALSTDRLEKSEAERTAALAAGTKKDKKDSDEDEDGNEDDDDGEDRGVDAFISDDEDMEDEDLTDEDTITTQFHREQLLRKKFDVKTMHPIFSGFGSRLADDFDVEETLALEASAKAEEAYDPNDFAVNDDELQAHIAKGEKERERRAKAQKERKERRDKASLKREKERRTNEKALAPDEYAVYFKTWKSIEDKVKAKEKKEDAMSAKKAREFEAKHSGIEKELTLTYQTALRQESQLMSMPRGRVLVDRYEKQITITAKKWNETKKNWKEKEEELREKEEGDDAVSRGIIIMMQGEVDRAKKMFDEAAERLDYLRERQELAKKMEARERRFSTLFEAVLDLTPEAADELGVPGADLRDILLLAVIFCGTSSKNMHWPASLREKMDWAYWRFKTSHELGDEKMLQSDLFNFLTRAARGLENLAAVEVSRRASGSELMGHVARAFQYEAAQNHFLSQHRFREWALELIRSSMLLSDIFGIPHKFAHMSEFQLLKMSSIQQIQTGMITLPNFVNRVNRDATQFRPLLGAGNKSVIHKRALAMGMSDPLKPDYASMIPRKQGGKGNAYVLKHGWYENAEVHDNLILMKASERIQTLFRARRGRHGTLVTKERAALLKALKRAKEGAAERVRLEFEKKENMQGQRRLKWNAKVRMRQMKEATKSGKKKPTREQVLQLMMAEQIAVMWEKVERRFDDMARTKGISENAVKQFRNLIGHKVRPPPGLPDTERKRALVRAQETLPEAAELFRRGEESSEFLLRLEMARPDPSYTQLYRRMRWLHKFVTERKARNILLESPSKRILLQKYRFWHLQKVADHFKENFNMRDDWAIALAKSLKRMLHTDLEYGKMANRAVALQRKKDSTLQDMVEFRAGKALRVQKEAAQRAVLMAQSQEDPERAMAILEQNKKKLIDKLESLKAKVGRRMSAVEEAELKLKDAKREMQRIGKMVRVQQAVNDDAQAALAMMQVSPEDRTNWVERFYHASNMPERTPEEKYVKYKEIHLVIDLFVSAAETHAKKIIKEFFMPRSEKLAKAFEVKKGDGERFVREKFMFHGIRFKVLLDYSGVYNGNDQAAMKMGGAELRATMAYYRCRVPKLRVPLQCVVDFLGFRVLCSAVVPIVHEDRDKKGKLRGLEERLVYGSTDRGFHCCMKSADGQECLRQAAAQLNIKEHQVKGRDDMMTCYAFAPFDARLYEGTDGNFYLLNPGRTFPPIDYDILSKRLGQSSSARGMSIFWRHFRPEFLHSLKNPLSSDAYTLVAHFADRLQAPKDGAECTEATKRLITENVTEFAKELSKRSESEIKAIVWSGEMHTRGMNVRLLGELRSRFWRQLDGTVGVEFGKKHLLTKKDWRLEIRRGSQLRVGETEMIFKVRARGKWDETQIPIEPAITIEPKGNVDVYAGEVEDQKNSDVVRASLLQEMAARAIKGIVRVQARESARIQQLFNETAFAEVCCNVFNLMTGSAPGYGKFWLEDVLLAIEERYGRFALSGIERWRLHTIMTEHHLAPTMRRLCEMLKVELTTATRERFEQQPLCFRFETPDIHAVNARVRLSVEQLRHFSKGCVIAADAKMAAGTTYRARILNPKDKSDPPVGYWPLDELLNSKIAKNCGTAASALDGRYSRAVRFRADGFVKNDSADGAVCSKGIGFVKGARAHIDFPPTEIMCPMQPKVHFSIETWVKVTGSPQKDKVIIENGRFLLQATKANYWIFLVYMPLNMVNVRVMSPKPFEFHVWYHIVCTYDGGQCRMYINGKLVAFVDITRSVKEALEDHARTRKQELIRIKDEENSESLKCEARARKVISAELKDPEARREMLRAALKLYQETTLKISLSKKTDKELKEEGIERITKRQAEGLIKERQFEFMKDIKEQCERRREALKIDEAHMKSAILERSKKIGRIGSSVPSGRGGDGGKYFVGTIQHVAFYRIGLTAEQAHEHYVMGTLDLRLESDRLYYLASLSFKRVLDENPYDRKTLVEYANSLCNHFGFGSDRKQGQEAYHSRITEALTMFRNGQNAAGAAALFDGLPDTGDATFADICCDVWDTVKEINPAFFEDSGNIADLAYMPIKFGLMRPGMALKYVRCAAEIYQYALHVEPKIYNDVDLSWLHTVSDPRIVVFFVDRAQRNLPMDVIDLEDLEDAPSSDLLSVCYNCRDVTRLVMNNALHLDDTVMNSISQRMRFLETLEIENCRMITDDAMECLGSNCSRLKTLNISGCIRISDLGLCEITKHCDDLRHLNVRHCKFISDTSIASLAKGCRKLEFLDITWCVHVTTKGMKAYADTAPFGMKLKELNMRGCARIKDNAIVSVANTFTALTSLDLAHVTQLTDKSVKKITHNCWQLSFLDLTQCALITDDCFWFDEISDGRPEAERMMLRQLTDVRLNDCVAITNHGLHGIAGRSRNLYQIQLSGCTGLDVDTVWDEFFHEPDTREPRHRGLTEISISHIPKLTDKAVETFMDNVQALEYISLNGNPKISDASLTVIAKRMSRVHRLDLSFCTQITDAGLKQLADELFMEELDISHCKYVTDEGLTALAESFNTLRKLNVTWCILLTDRTLKALQDNCPGLSVCNISQCHRMTDNGVASLKKALPHTNVIRRNLKPLFHKRGTDHEGRLLPDIAKENAKKQAELDLHYARTGERFIPRKISEQEKLIEEHGILNVVLKAKSRVNAALERAQQRGAKDMTGEEEMKGEVEETPETTTEVK
eukprot:g4165.t1